MPNFNALKFAESLTLEQLEFLSEFSEQAEEQLCQLQESPKRTIFGQDTTDSRGGSSPGKHRLPQHEWTAELGREIPTKKGKKKKLLPAILTTEEIQILFDHTKDKPRNHLILRTLYAAGLRRKELSKLIRADLYPTEQKLFIREGKGGKDRYVLIDKATTQLLDDYTRNHRPQDSIFGISDKTVARTVKAAVEETGIQARYEALGRKFTAHSFRHTFATHMYEAGVDLFVLKDLLGHQFLNVTERYARTGIASRMKDYIQAHPLARDD